MLPFNVILYILEILSQVSFIYIYIFYFMYLCVCLSMSVHHLNAGARRIQNRFWTSGMEVAGDCVHQVGVGTEPWPSAMVSSKCS